MAKQNKKHQVEIQRRRMAGRYQHNEETAPDNFLYTDEGRKVRIGPISILDLETVSENVKARFREEGRPIEPPTYSVKVGVDGKDAIEYPIDEDSLIVEGNEEESERRQTAWAEYQKALNEMQAEIGRITNEMFLDAVLDEPENDNWIKLRERRGLDVPEDEYERLLLWKRTVCLKSVADFERCQLAVMQLTSGGRFTEEELAAAASTFQD